MDSGSATGAKQGFFVPSTYKGYIVAGMVFTVIIVAGLIAALVWAIAHKHPCSCSQCVSTCCPSSMHFAPDRGT